MSQSEREMKEEIKHRLSRNNYYHILDITNDSSSQDLKKAYKKLALRFHPDKNESPGAKEVFNKVSHAYTELSDNQKKVIYDEKLKRANSFNSQKQKYQQSSHNFGTFFEMNNKWEERMGQEEAEKKKREFQKQKEDMEKEFLRAFSKLFENSKSEGSFSKQYQQKNEEKEITEKMKRQYMEERRNKERKERIAKEDSKNKKAFVIFSILLISFILWPILKNRLFSKPIYSFYRSSVHNTEIKTPIFKYPYFVESKSYGELSIDKKNQLNESIDKKYMSSLKKECSQSQKERKLIEEKAFREKIGRRREAYLSKANKIDDSSCTVLFELSKEHPEYFETLVK